jgi:hypothetical protein
MWIVDEQDRIVTIILDPFSIFDMAVRPQIPNLHFLMYFGHRINDNHRCRSANNRRL